MRNGATANNLKLLLKILEVIFFQDLISLFLFGLGRFEDVYESCFDCEAGEILGKTQNIRDEWQIFLRRSDYSSRSIVSEH